MREHPLEGPATTDLLHCDLENWQVQAQPEQQEQPEGGQVRKQGWGAARLWTLVPGTVRCPWVRGPCPRHWGTMWMPGSLWA